MDCNYPRDMIGYGGNPPDPQWPGKARIALQFVLNYEEGGENSILHGDQSSETFLSDISNAKPYSSRHLSMESLYEYGSRAGFWRLHRLFSESSIPVTVFAVGMALERNPDALQAMLDANWEIASHGLRWISYQDISIEEERAQMAEAIELHKKLTGNKKLGWYTGRTSPNTLSLVSEQDAIVYCADSYADDLPYYDMQYKKPILMVPYTLDTNDMKFCGAQGFNQGNDFYQYLTDAFNVLYDEGSTQPKMLSVGLHCRIAGRPARFAALKKFIQHIQSFEDVWVCTRMDIAQHWKKHHVLNEPKR